MQRHAIALDTTNATLTDAVRCLRLLLNTKPSRTSSTYNINDYNQQAQQCLRERATILPLMYLLHIGVLVLYEYR